MVKFKRLFGVGLGVFMAFAAICASGAGKGEVVIATNEVVNYHLQKNQPSVTFAMTNNAPEPYLWIMARACDNRKIEHAPGGLLKVEVNGVEIGPDRLVLQGATFAMPVHATSWRKAWKKYDNETKGWRFKYDVDFIANNQCGATSNWGAYTTADLNYWYAFNVKGAASNGVNQVKIIEQIRPGQWKSGYYDGFMVGALGFGNLEDMKQRVAAYAKRQIKIKPEEMSYEKNAKKQYNLEIPKGLAQKFAVNNGFILRDGKPFFMAYANPFSVGRDSVLKIYDYYGLINVRMSGPGGAPSQEIFGLPIWLKEGWDKYRPQPWEIGRLLHETRLNYDQGILTMLYCLEPYGMTSPYLPDNFPELIAQTADGKPAKSPENGEFFPNHAAPLYQEYLRQSHTVLGREFKDHPGVFGVSPWEEMGWRTPQSLKKLVPQGPEDLKRYRAWLAKKYGTIGRLNEEWGVDYKTFDDVTFPEGREQTANFANFQSWRSGETVKCARIQYEAFKGAVPDQLVLGQKTYGDLGASSGAWTHDVDNWALTEWTDVSREYSATPAMAHLGRASCRAFGGKAMEADICFGSCEFRQWTRTNEWHYLLDLKGKAAYPYIMQMVFNGNKAIHWETYDLGHGGDYHFIHYNKHWQKGGKTWDGKGIGYDSPGTADVVIEERTMKIARAQQLVMRNASLFLPAQAPKSDVAVLITTVSRMIGHDPQDKLAKTKSLIQTWVNNPGQDYYVLGSLFDNMHLTFDCVEERVIDEIFKYKVLIVGYQANVMSRKTAEKIKDYVKKGGTVLFYPEGGTWDSVNFQKDKSVKEISPGFGLSDLCGARIDNDKIIDQNGIVVKKEINGYKAGETVMTNRYYGVKLESTGGEVVATTEDGQPVLVKGANGKAWYFGGYLGLAYYQSYDEHERFAQLVEGILKSAGVEKRVELKSILKIPGAKTSPFRQWRDAILASLKLRMANCPICRAFGISSLEGMADRRKVIPGLLEGEGKGYWLVGVNNFDDNAYDLKIKVNQMPAGEYEVVDISGEGFTFEKGKDGNCHMKPDPEGAKAKYVTKKISGKNLGQNGFTGDVEKYMGKVWLIRPAGKEVWVNTMVSALKSCVELKKPLKIVMGHGGNEEEQKLAAELSQILAKQGLTVSVVKDNEIKTKVLEGNLMDDGYELEKYSHKVIDDDANLILIGNASENSVVKYLETAGNYVFNKVPEIVDEKYPGKGRGIIQLVESINHFSYDATGKGRDAILAGGSDRDGTIKAVKELTRILVRP